VGEEIPSGLPDPTRVTGFGRLLDADANQLPAVLSPDSLRVFLTGLRGLRAVLVQVGADGDRPPDLLRVAAERYHIVWERAVGELLRSHRSIENRIRLVAWALQAGIDELFELTLCHGGAAIRIAQAGGGEAERGVRGQPVVWWMNDQPVPRALLDAARRDELLLVGDAATAGCQAVRHRVHLSCDAALVRTAPEGAMRLSGAAAYVQALLARDHDGAWARAQAPAGYVGLERGFSLREESARLEEGLITPLTETYGSRRLVFSLRSLPNFGNGRCSTRWHGKPQEESMKHEKPLIEYPQEEGLKPDEQSLPPGYLIVPAMELEQPRSKEELTRELREISVDSVEDIARGFGVFIEGRFENPEGEVVHARIPVRNEQTFTPDGMTKGDPELFRIYVASRTFDEVARLFSARKIDRLDPGVLAKLEELEAVLAKAVEADAEGVKS
jgi:hypothetical protein